MGSLCCIPRKAERAFGIVDPLGELVPIFPCTPAAVWSVLQPL